MRCSKWPPSASKVVVVVTLWASALLCATMTVEARYLSNKNLFRRNTLQTDDRPFESRFSAYGLKEDPLARFLPVLAAPKSVVPLSKPRPFFASKQPNKPAKAKAQKGFSDEDEDELMALLNEGLDLEFRLKDLIGSVDKRYQK